MPIKIRRASDKKFEMGTGLRPLLASSRSAFPSGAQDYIIQADIKTPKGRPKPEITVHIDDNERKDVGIHLTEQQLRSRRSRLRSHEEVARHWSLCLAFCWRVARLAIEDSPGRVGSPCDNSGKRPRVNQRILTGTVLDKSDQPIANAVVYLKNKKTLNVKTFFAQKDGTYRFPATWTAMSITRFMPELDGKKQRHQDGKPVRRPRRAEHQSANLTPNK